MKIHETANIRGDPTGSVPFSPGGVPFFRPFFRFPYFQFLLVTSILK